MRHTRIKIVTSKAGKTLYYRGDGLWFGRISAQKALLALATKECVLWSCE
jgi:hypothetical protein